VFDKISVPERRRSHDRGYIDQAADVTARLYELQPDARRPGLKRDYQIAQDPETVGRSITKTMKYMVISKPGEMDPRGVTHEAVEQGKRMLQAGKDQGIIEAAYTLVGGGNVMIVNADSHEILARALRKLRAVANAPHVEVHPILDTSEVLESYEGQLDGDKAS
jgi:hypothetical protein